MKILVNDEPKYLDQDSNLARLAEDMGLSQTKGWAIALNETIVPKTKFNDTVLKDGDRILLIKATQGG